MTKTVEAIYERGVLRLKEPIQLADGTEVEVTVVTREIVRLPERSPAEILASIAALPLEGEDTDAGL
ncbi:MAG: hypothetical protein AUG51_09010 [Acidobacteria bacterium 13_1_20CM_3_53_8]|nr:MAG: hypothetical protein AUG51_09010 [Acidobacteria bacterium 13_1_20CM_3_53_8]